MIKYLLNISIFITIWCLRKKLHNTTQTTTIEGAFGKDKSLRKNFNFEKISNDEVYPKY